MQRSTDGQGRTIGFIDGSRAATASSACSTRTPARSVEVRRAARGARPCLIGNAV
jgi:hypothetical protein